MCPGGPRRGLPPLLRGTRLAPCAILGDVDTPTALSPAPDPTARPAPPLRPGLLLSASKGPGRRDLFEGNALLQQPRGRVEHLRRGEHHATRDAVPVRGSLPLLCAYFICPQVSHVILLSIEWVTVTSLGVIDEEPDHIRHRRDHHQGRQGLDDGRVQLRVNPERQSRSRPCTRHA